MATPRNSAPRNPAPRRGGSSGAAKPAPPVIPILLVLAGGVGLFAFMMLGGEKEPEPAPVKPASVPIATKPATAPSPPKGLQFLPPDVQKALNLAADKPSSKVDGLVKRQMALEKEADPAVRREKIEELRDEFAAVAEELENVIDDKTAVWAKFRHDPEYTHAFAQYLKRFDFYTKTQNELRKLSEAALWESKQKKDAVAVPASTEKPASQPASTEKPASQPK